MEALKKSLDDHVDNFDDSEHADMPLTISAKNWASHCLETYVGDLLQKGLAIAGALAEFEVELYQSERQGQ